MQRLENKICTKKICNYMSASRRRWKVNINIGRKEMAYDFVDGINWLQT
jgi:hypothetical protein